MSTLTSHILGTGIVTPHGTSVAFSAGPPPVTEVTNPETGRKHLIATVPTAFTSHLAREPRLRRASNISMLAATAAHAAIAQSGITPNSRTALVVGVSNGCAQYTRRFYEQIVKTGANTASPLLFPETVHNAPASHLASMLKLDGATYTLIGDATIGLQALHFANQLLAMRDADNVIVVAAEELDWILAEGHQLWRLTSRTGACRPYAGGGTLLAEGAAATVLSLDGNTTKLTTTSGQTIPGRRHATAALRATIAALGGPVPNHIVDGANGTWLDDSFAEFGPADRRISPKANIGEAIGASALQQVVLATTLAGRTLVPALGWNQQAAAAIVET